MLGNLSLGTQMGKALLSSDDERHIGFLISDVARLMRTAFDAQTACDPHSALLFGVGKQGVQGAPVGLRPT